VTVGVFTVVANCVSPTDPSACGTTYTYTVSASGFPANTPLTYTCSGGVAGSGAGSTTSASGSASFTTTCSGHIDAGSSQGVPAESVTVSGGGSTATGNYSG
jgi:hypothetical protein